MLKIIEGSCVKKGDLVFTEDPFAFLLLSKYRKERCDNCLKLSRVLKCSVCNYVYYCDRSCQVTAWKLHKVECAFLKKSYPRIVPDAARIICRIITILRSGGEQTKGYYTSTKYRRFVDLMSHINEIKKDMKKMEHLESLLSVVAEIMDSQSLPNFGDLMLIYGKLITNGFNILDEEMNPIGTGIYLGASIVDHSCTPNAIATFNGTTIRIHVTEDINCLDWSKIFICYIDLLNSAKDRREALACNYFFLCNCTKCSNPTEDFEMSAGACPNKECDACVDILLEKCMKCSTSISLKYRNNFLQAISFTKTNLECMKEVAFLDLSKICLEKQKGYVHPLNIWHVKTLDVAFEAAVCMKKWSDALHFGVKLIPGFKKYYGDWNPLLGLLYFKIGKIQQSQGYYKDCEKNFIKSIKILEVTHGSDNSLVKNELIPMLQEVNRQCSK